MLRSRRSTSLTFDSLLAHAIDQTRNTVTKEIESSINQATAIVERCSYGLGTEECSKEIVTPRAQSGKEADH